MFLTFVLILNFAMQVMTFKVEHKERSGVCCCGEGCDCGCGGMCAKNREISVQICISSAPCDPLFKINLDYPVKEAIIPNFNFDNLNFPTLEFLNLTPNLHFKLLCFDIFHPPERFLNKDNV